MEKLWLNSYEQGVNAEIDITQYSSISDVFRQSVEKFAHQPAFQNMGKTLTYAEVGKLAQDFASYLQNVLKLPRGERVAIMLPNLLQYPIALFGILQAGVVAGAACAHGCVHGRSAGVGAGFSVVLVDDVYECFTDYSQHGFNSTYVFRGMECVFVGI